MDSEVVGIFAEGFSDKDSVKVEQINANVFDVITSGKLMRAGN